MDIPFISSGALSRVHYALVRKIEEATSEGSVNVMLDAEVISIREQLARPSLSLVRVLSFCMLCYWH
jgi:AP-4 complex subunit epsilon-1